jgi:succinate dehydrogenase / fumarate reductase flavoprotein subunit
VGPLKNGVYLDFADAIARVGRGTIEERYGNLFEMYERITDEDPYTSPMRIYPAPHYTMGGLWVDYELMTTVPGLYAAGEANFSDHGANRLGASALMQGLADGYFVLPYTISSYLAPKLGAKLVPTDHPAFRAAEDEARSRFAGYLATNGKRSVDWFHRELGRIMWDHCGMERTAEGLEKAMSEIPALHAEFKQDMRVPGDDHNVNQSLEKAGRVDDFFELASLLCRDALDRNESCGAHFRAEYQTEDGEAQRDDEHYAYVAAWEWTGDAARPAVHKEELDFEYVHLTVRSYK